jgi:hypothetical protein
MKALRFGWMIALLGVTALGCADDADDTQKDTSAAGAAGAENSGAGAAGAENSGAGGEQNAPLEVIGTWESEFGEETISAEIWSYAAIVEYDNETNIVITQNPDGDDPMLFPNAYSRIVYTEPVDDVFSYCTSDYGLETLEEAREAMGDADPENLESGCGNFSWTTLTKK